MIKIILPMVYCHEIVKCPLIDLNPDYSKNHPCINIQ